MKPQVLLKLGAVLSSALLMAAFVAYRAGAFGWLTPATAPPPSADTAPVAAPAVKAPLDSSPAPNSAPPSAQLDPFLMSSSKSIILAEPQTAKPAVPASPPAAQQKPPTLLPGPKSFNPQYFLQGLTPELPPPPTAARPPKPKTRPVSGGPQR